VNPIPIFYDRTTYGKYGSASMDIFTQYGAKLLSVEDALK